MSSGTEDVVPDSSGEQKEVPKRSFRVEGNRQTGFVSGAIPVVVAQSAADRLACRSDVEDELDMMADMIKGFWEQEPDLVMRQVAAISARLTELSLLLHRAETRDRQFKQIRTLQCAPLLVELDRQYKIASRLVELRRQDLDLLK